MSHEGRAGDLAVVFDHERRFVAVGLYDPSSPIRVKVLHAGNPTTVDALFWRTRLASAIAWREDLAADHETTAYRIVNGENDGFPGLVIDRYGDVAVMKVYAECWFAHLPALVPLVEELLSAQSIVLRLARRIEGVDGFHDGTLLAGRPVDGPVLFRENGLIFEAEVVRGHKTGHFLDQRDNRQRVRGLTEDADVLDVFSCSGGFSVYAAAGGAKSVVSVDLSSAAVDAVARNLAANTSLDSVGRCDATQVVGDAFRVMDECVRRRDRFDVVIVDPPSFAPNQAAVEKAERAYVRLNRLALSLLRSGGVLVSASCSSRISADHFYDLVYDAADQERRELYEIARTGHAVDHPVTFDEGGYLKALFARVE
jgi:23S rRNA (cytosine1962-C5)-methyltransferase